MTRRLRLLALEPWLGGSHQAFLEGWRARSVHDLEILGLPARHWKWRMRGAAWELARACADLAPPDVLVATDYLDLPSFRGLAPPAWRAVPTLVYFHENQLTFPSRPGEAPRERDHHYGFTNVLTCLAADTLVFNSRFHLDDFGAAALALVRALPTPNPAAELERALARAHVIGPGVDLDAIPLGPGGPGRALRVVFNHRWEHDKDPLAFLRAVRAAAERGAALELVLLGQRFAELPEGCAEALEAVRHLVVHDGYAESREAYAALLGTCDVVVSTARHEFYGISVLEALAAGATPLLPDRLSYPELLAGAEPCWRDDEELVSRFVELANEPGPTRDPDRRAKHRELADGHSLDRTARLLDSQCAAAGQA
ncbi:MAG: DUF3524 domain-containing protein [Planctomycetes bacterium]|nr:DUF3524 domain-containing protein [Planctomycetota bacterium]